MSSSDGKRSPKSPNKSPREKSPKSPKSKSPTGAKKPSVPVQAPLTASKKSKTPNVIDDGKKKYFLLLFLGWFDWFNLFNVFLFIQKIEYLQFRVDLLPKREKMAKNQNPSRKTPMKLRHRLPKTLMRDSYSMLTRMPYPMSTQS